MDFVCQFLSGDIEYGQMHTILTQPTIIFSQEEAIDGSIEVFSLMQEEDVNDSEYAKKMQMNGYLRGIINAILSKCPTIKADNSIKPEFIPVICLLAPPDVVTSKLVDIASPEIFNQYIAAHANSPMLFKSSDKLSDFLDWVLQFCTEANPLAVVQELIPPLFSMVAAFDTFGKLSNTHCEFIGMLAVEMLRIRLEEGVGPEEAIVIIIDTIGMMNGKYMYISSIDKKMAEFLTQLELFQNILQFAYEKNCTKDIIFRLITYCVMTGNEPIEAPPTVLVPKLNEHGLLPIGELEYNEVESDMQQFIEFTILLQRGDTSILTPEILNIVFNFKYAQNQTLWLYRYVYLMVTNIEDTPPELFHILLENDPDVFQDNPELALLFVALGGTSLELPPEIIEHIIKDVKQLPTEFFIEE